MISLSVVLDIFELKETPFIWVGSQTFEGTVHGDKPLGTAGAENEKYKSPRARGKSGSLVVSCKVQR